MIQNNTTTGPWFATQSLHRSIDRATWDRGLTLYLTQKVLTLAIERMRDYWLLLADVQGSERRPCWAALSMTATPCLHW